MNKNLAKRVSHLLEKMSVEELASKLKVSSATVFRWKAGTIKKPHRSLISSLEELERGSKSAVR